MNIQYSIISQRSESTKIFLMKTYKYRYYCDTWWRGTVVERRSLAGELSLSCARPAADG